MRVGSRSQNTLVVLCIPIEFYTGITLLDREVTMKRPGLTFSKQGLYDPRNEHDACGVGFVCHVKGVKSHLIIKQGLSILTNLSHRGAVGSDPLAGDGAGILIQVPDEFLRSACQLPETDIALPPIGKYGVGMVFLPQEPNAIKACKAIFAQFIQAEGQTLLGWRDVPVNNQSLGESVKRNEPVISQVFVGCGDGVVNQDVFERKLFVIRKQVEKKMYDSVVRDKACFCIPSLSSRTLLYKGMLLAHQVGSYYKDLNDSRLTSALALVHQRFSTNTFPSWALAQPFRICAHNGEINTLRGNVNWMAARRASMASVTLGADLDKLWPVILEGQSDSACFDNAFELLVAGGYSLAHAAMMLVPEAWARNEVMDKKRQAFYEYHAAIMEPWDGPAAIAFTDGRQIGALLDRNGLRPARYVITDDDMVIMASEVGVLDIPERKIVKKWRLQPGKMFLIDLQKGRIIDDAELKTKLVEAHPYQNWLNKTQITLDDLPEGVVPMRPDATTLLYRQKGFGYTQEDIKFFLAPMALTGLDPIISMGSDTPLAVLSSRSKTLYNYFKQRFAQVTNPPIDPIREELVMSLVSLIGPRPNLLDLESGGSHMRLEVCQPILSNANLEKIHRIDVHTGGAFKTQTLSFCYSATEGVDGMAPALEKLCQAAEDAVRGEANILILSDRAMNADFIAIPALLAVSAVHHHLVRNGLRTEAGLVVETGEAREVHHFCVLAGFGAEAINPYLAFETLSSIRLELPELLAEEELFMRYTKAVGKGIYKVMSKMGISTFHSYCGAQIFDIVGLTQEFVDRYFNGTVTTVEGADFAAIAEETVRRHNDAFGNKQIYRNALDVGGDHALRVRGENHFWRPETISSLQHASRSNNSQTYKEFASLVNDENEKLLTLRSLFRFSFDAESVPLAEVESIENIVKRFATGAMSFGSISYEAHTTLAIAMNRLGGKSNTGEGGEDPERFIPLANGDSKRSAIKQVASGRFGVTIEYLVNSDDIQIKMAQGAKPGEGGQLPGHKVDRVIAKVRYSTPYVGLISPPPHHDIYSIEDLAQLIYDLKNANPQARISVKLVSEVGVGTVAAGVCKAHADHVTISGYDGGTGASPITSVKHAGSPWEIGLAETHQTLVLNRLRGRIAVQVDGGLRTGRDVVIAAMLGADEFGFATAPLVVQGCIMMRKCHLNTCPVGVATQDKELRKRFTGKPEHLVNYFCFVAQEIRELMAQLGFRTFAEMIGRSDRLNTHRAIDHYKAKGLDFARIFYRPEVGPDVAVYNCEKQEHGLEKTLDHALLKQARKALDRREPVRIKTVIKNTDRTVGTILSGELARRYGQAGLPEDTIYIQATGTAGQSFGAFLAHGITIELMGDANDYVGKGLSGGRLIIYPPKESNIVPEENIIVGNTVLYGATSGQCFFRGVGGERFAVRNSGAVAVIDGVGDHGCEYMTGGIVVVLGSTGRNFAAGMSGGIAYVLDEDGNFAVNCNLSMVELETIDGDYDLTKWDEWEPTMPMPNELADMSKFDALRLRCLITQHAHYTNSKRAQEILKDWDQVLPKFVKIMPKDYRRALNEMQQEATKNGTETAAA